MDRSKVHPSLQPCLVVAASWPLFLTSHAPASPRPPLNTQLFFTENQRQGAPMLQGMEGSGRVVEPHPPPKAGGHPCSRLDGRERRSSWLFTRRCVTGKRAGEGGYLVSPYVGPRGWGPVVVGKEDFVSSLLPALRPLLERGL